MKVYGDVRSGNCDKVRYMADYLNLPYKWIEIDAAGGKTRTPEFLTVNPQGQVPVVEFGDGKRLMQSNAIIRYLAEGSPLLPTDKWARAKIDEWMFWEANNFEYHVAGCYGHMTYMGKTKETRDPIRVARGEQALDIFEEQLGSSNWLIGGIVSVADFSLLGYTRLAHLGGFDMARRPRIQRWLKRCEDELKLSPVSNSE